MHHRQGFNFRKFRQMQPVIFENSLDNLRTIVAREMVVGHVFVAHAEQGGEYLAFGLVQVMFVHGYLRNKHTVKHIEVTVLGDGFRVGEYPQIMQQAQ